jgi:hypothetical protein
MQFDELWSAQAPSRLCVPQLSAPCLYGHAPVLQAVRRCHAVQHVLLKWLPSAVLSVCSSAVEPIAHVRRMCAISQINRVDVTEVQHQLVCANSMKQCNASVRVCMGGCKGTSNQHCIALLRAPSV